MGYDESDHDGLERNVYQHEITIWKMMGGNESD